MRFLAVLIAACLPFTLLADLPTPQVEYKKKPGPGEVASFLLDWKDTKRNRAVPCKVYYPKSDKGPFPVIVFSHGLGGSREGYGYIGKHWASHGYACVHLQHPGSDEGVWKGKKNPLEAMRKSLGTPGAAMDRFRDVPFALDQITDLNKSDPRLKGKLDLEKIGLAGHSYGATTTLTLAGQTWQTPRGMPTRMADVRIKAAIAMSPAPQAGKADPKKAFATIKIPVLHMTGTEDDGVAVTETKAADRRVPYDNSPGPHQYLVVFTDGDHMVFSGRTIKGGLGKNYSAIQDHTRMSTTAFWDAHLRGIEAARTWLTKQFGKTLGKDGTFEFKAK